MHKKILQVLVLITSLAIVGAPCHSMDDSETNRTNGSRIRVNQEQGPSNNPFLTGYALEEQPSLNPFRSNAAHQEQGLSNSSLTTQQPTYNPWNQSQNSYPLVSATYHTDEIQQLTNQMQQLALELKSIREKLRIDLEKQLALEKENMQQILLELKNTEEEEALLYLEEAILEEMAQSNTFILKNAILEQMLQNNKVTLDLIQRLAKIGNRRAQYILGIYYESNGGYENETKAKELFHKAAEQGNTAAQYQLGIFYAAEGIHQNKPEAAKWLLKAAEQGLAEAISHLQNSKLADTPNLWNQSQNQYPPAPIVQQHIPNPWNQPQNQYSSVSTTQQPTYNPWNQSQNQYPSAPTTQQPTYNLWNQSQNQYPPAPIVQQHIPNPWNQTQNQYSSAPIVQQHPSNPWYESQNPYPLAETKYNLSLRHLARKGEAHKTWEGVKWLEKAVDQGLAEAQYNLGICYLNGIGMGITQNTPEGLKLLQKAVDQGLAEAQNDLGLRYIWGTKVAQNIPEGLKLLQKAAGQGHVNASSFLQRQVTNSAPQKQPVQAHSQEHHDVSSKATDDEDYKSSSVCTHERLHENEFLNTVTGGFLGRYSHNCSNTGGKYIISGPCTTKQQVRVGTSYCQGVKVDHFQYQDVPVYMPPLKTADDWRCSNCTLKFKRDECWGAPNCRYVSNHKSGPTIFLTYTRWGACSVLLKTIPPWNTIEFRNCFWKNIVEQAWQIAVDKDLKEGCEECKNYKCSRNVVEEEKVGCVVQ